MGVVLRGGGRRDSGRGQRGQLARQRRRQHRGQLCRGGLYSIACTRREHVVVMVAKMVIIVIMVVIMLMIVIVMAVVMPMAVVMAVIVVIMTVMVVVGTSGRGDGEGDVHLCVGRGRHGGGVTHIHHINHSSTDVVSCFLQSAQGGHSGQQPLLLCHLIHA